VKRVKRAQQLGSIGFQVAALMTSVRRFKDARRTGDKLEVADAILNAGVVLTGMVLLIRSLRRGEE
jgi:hypothetical protein